MRGLVIFEITRSPFGPAAPGLGCGGLLLGAAPDPGGPSPYWWMRQRRFDTAGFLPAGPGRPTGWSRADAHDRMARRRAGSNDPEQRRPGDGAPTVSHRSPAAGGQVCLPPGPVILPGLTCPCPVRPTRPPVRCAAGRDTGSTIPRRPSGGAPRCVSWSPSWRRAPGLGAPLAVFPPGSCAELIRSALAALRTLPPRLESPEATDAFRAGLVALDLVERQLVL